MSISTSTYGNVSIKYHWPFLWNITLEKGMAIVKHIRNNIRYEHLHSIHNFKLFKKALSLHLHMVISATTRFISHIFPCLRFSCIE